VWSRAQTGVYSTAVTFRGGVYSLHTHREKTSPSPTFSHLFCIIVGRMSEVPNVTPSETLADPIPQFDAVSLTNSDKEETPVVEKVSRPQVLDDLNADKSALFTSALEEEEDSGVGPSGKGDADWTPTSDSLEEISLQADDKEGKEIPEEDVDLNDDDDIFKSARLEPEPVRLVKETNGREVREEPVEVDIPLEDDDLHPFEDAHLKPQLQLSGPGSSSTPATMQTLTSFHDTAALKKELSGDDEFLEVKVTAPHKVGEGMSSFMAYKVCTKTNLAYFKKKSPEVNRRFSDFLGLREKLAEKYLQNGRIIPPAPDKSVIGMTKVKMAKEDEDATHSDFVEKRRAALERYLNRTASHPNLRVDPDFREFLELDTDLPKASQTATLSGKTVMKLFNSLGDKVSAYTTKMEESDAWFEEKNSIIESLDTQLRKLLVATDSLVEFRKGLAGHTYSLSKSLGLLSSAEENSQLSAAINLLAEVEEKVEKVHEQQAKDDFFLLSELVRDYIGVVGSVREAFNERSKAWQAWQGIQRDLTRRREAKVKAELACKQERVNQLRQEIAENERQVDMAQENFDKISRIIKKEYEAFDVKKAEDFKVTLTDYLERMLKSQEVLTNHWEKLLPEIKQVELTH